MWFLGVPPNNSGRTTNQQSLRKNDKDPITVERTCDCQLCLRSNYELIGCSHFGFAIDAIRLSGVCPYGVRGWGTQLQHHFAHRIPFHSEGLLLRNTEHQGTTRPKTQKNVSPTPAFLLWLDSYCEHILLVHETFEVCCCIMMLEQPSRLKSKKCPLRTKEFLEKYWLMLWIR